ncbi:DsbA family protein [Hoeflea olei]|uniref:2-hydroxychromene-2-carboxylate isomerase n=1 Tax=Hoeflea olei TaxID=1480615 RepID=A0A1C1YSQ8_9HYPH|nr:DsbA family protein [Hoeflea olei]OCW56397.1 disulfide bond formation protein DsbA [Hoeflea olei]
MVEIAYYFHCASPHTYLGHNRICDVAERHKVSLRYKPVNAADIHDASWTAHAGALPTTQPAAQIAELKRLAALRGLTFHPSPKHRPVNSGLADRVIIGLVESEHDPRYFTGKVLAGAWAQDDAIADQAVLSSYLSQVGLDALPALVDAKTERAGSIRDSNTRDALAAGAVTVPAYVLNGEVFLGQDKIERLEDMLRSRR